MKFLDQVKIFLKSGDGGAGCLSFRREKYIEFGGPNGGNGGKGGNIYVQGVHNLNTLIDYRYQQHFKAEKGHQGKGQERTGRHGHDIVLKVPVGTQIFDEHKETLLLDVTTEEEKVLLLKGGDGGFGNSHYKSSTHQAPRRADPGWPGQEMWVWMQLKLIADVGLLGLPNAGKSTFLSVVSRAKPKIADYPFTTLHPQLGVVFHHDKEFVISDLPGLIKNAHQSAGLGHRFLGHVERCKVLLHLIDGTQDDVCQAYHTIHQELVLYGSDLDNKPELIILNKIDALTDDMIVQKKQELEACTGQTVYALSSISKKGLTDILNQTLTILDDII
jgi:GTP-binding protein